MKGRHWLPPLIWAGVIVFATSMPKTMVPRQVGHWDKVVHFAIYAVLGALVTLAVQRRTAIRILALVVCAVAAFGAVDEWHQRFIPGRSTEFADWIADAAGGLAGVIVASLILMLLPKRSQA